AVVLPDSTDCDVIAMEEGQLEAAVQIFHVRGGRIRGQRGYVVDKITDVGAGALMETFLGQLYGVLDGTEADVGGGPVSRDVLVSHEPLDSDAVSDCLSERRGVGVELRVAQ